LSLSWIVYFKLSTEYTIPHQELAAENPPPLSYDSMILTLMAVMVAVDFRIRPSSWSWTISFVFVAFKS